MQKGNYKMSTEQKPKCPKCESLNLAVERRIDGDAKCLDCAWQGPYAECFQKVFEDVEQKFKQWFYDRGFREADLMYADAAYKKYQKVEESRLDKRPWDKAPGFKRIFMMGYFYGRNES
jgi:hypothetical protein